MHLAGLDTRMKHSRNTRQPCFLAAECDSLGAQNLQPYVSDPTYTHSASNWPCPCHWQWCSHHNPPSNNGSNAPAMAGLGPPCNATGPLLWRIIGVALAHWQSTYQCQVQVCSMVYSISCHIQLQRVLGMLQLGTWPTFVGCCAELTNQDLPGW